MTLIVSVLLSHIMLAASKTLAASYVAAAFGWIHALTVPTIARICAWQAQLATQHTQLLARRAIEAPSSLPSLAI